MKMSIKHKYLTKLLFLLGLFFISQAASAQSKTSTYSGIWVLNADKSDFGRQTVAAAVHLMTVTIEQLDNSISITTGDSTQRTVDLVKLDGTPSGRITNEVISGIPNIIKKSLAVQVISSQSFVETASDPGNSSSSSVRTYSISADLQTLTIDCKNKIGDYNIVARLVYDRKKGS